MEWFLVSGYTAICIAVFTILRIPLNRWTVPATSIGGIVMILALVQLLNYFHPHSGMSRQYVTTAPTGQLTAEPPSADAHGLVAWFDPNTLLRLDDGSVAEVTFDSIPGQVFSGRVRKVAATDVGRYGTRGQPLDSADTSDHSRIPVLVDITDPRYEIYVSKIPDGSHAQTAVYGERFQPLARVRQTLLRMSAWMNYLPLFS